MKVFYIGLLFFISTILNSATIKGYVFSDDNEPLVEANITISGTSLGASTDENGFYYIKGVKNGKYELFCQYIGYYSRKVTNIEIVKDQVFDLDFLLFKKVYELKSVTLKKSQDKPIKDNYTYRLDQQEVEFGKIILQDYSYVIPEYEIEISFWDKLRWRFWKLFND